MENLESYFGMTISDEMECEMINAINAEIEIERIENATQRVINLSDSDFCEVIRLLNSLSDEIKSKMDALDIDKEQEMYSSLLLNRGDILSLKRRIEKSAMRNYYKSNGLSDSEVDNLISKLLK